ncbi:hypothetical protein Lesp02_16370 [Lentzea sp. NBRC 105346]|nr:hypothetical protein Lesp02_16370 [Lentzea sp. NBRC 105346]
MVEVSRHDTYPSYSAKQLGKLDRVVEQETADLRMQTAGLNIGAAISAVAVAEPGTAVKVELCSRSCSRGWSCSTTSARKGRSSSSTTLWPKP